MSTKAQLQLQLDQLDQQMEQLFEEIQPHSAEILNARPAPDKWSVMQNMHHLMRSEQLSMRYVEKKLSFNPSLKRANWRTSLRLWVVKTYLKTPIKFKAPKGVGEDLPEVSDYDAVVKEWKASRQQMRTFLLDLPEDLLSKEVYKHPFGGRLSLSGMLDFMEVHTERHRGQIRRALKV